MRWLHGFLNDVEQVITQLAQVYFLLTSSNSYCMLHILSDAV